MSASASTSASSSRYASPAPSSSSAAGPAQAGQTIDPYRPLATQVKKPLHSLVPPSTTTPNLPTLFSLDPTTYSSRLSGKTLLFGDSSTANTSSAGPSASPLVQGKKRNRGNEADRIVAQRQAEERQNARAKLGHTGLRKVKKRLGSVVHRGAKISYTSLLPLHHLHTHYLLTLLALPPLPPVTKPVPSTLPPINPETVLSKLSKADFTGALLSVVSSRNRSLAGLSGIVIEETAGTFRLVSSDDTVRVAPKDGTLFRLAFPAYAPRSPLPLELTHEEEAMRGPLTPPDMSEHLSTCPRMEIDILGTAFGYRSGERAGRKFRPAQGGGGGSGWGEEWVEGDWNRTLSSLQDVLSEESHGGPRGKKEKNERAGGNVGSGARRKRGKSRRKDPPAGGSLAVF